jgi:hypothetical protein
VLRPALARRDKAAGRGSNAWARAVKVMQEIWLSLVIAIVAVTFLNIASKIAGLW